MAEENCQVQMGKTERQRERGRERKRMTERDKID